jgi:hypothetical protein
VLRTKWFNVDDGMTSSMFHSAQSCTVKNTLMNQSPVGYTNSVTFWLEVFLCIFNILGVFVSVQVGIWRSRAYQKQIQHTQISNLSFAYWLFQTPCQHCLTHRCVWRVTTYGPYVLSKNSATVQNSLAPLKVCLHSCMYLLSCVNWMDQNTHWVYRTHDQ